MNTYKIKLNAESSSLTPFHADTVFGHLCWIVAHREGEESLREFLKPFMEGNPPFVISDGFPGDLLPKPLSAEFGISDPQEHKEIKKIEYVSIDDFNRMRTGEKFKPESSYLQIEKTVTSHNVINRLTNTTFQDAGVFSHEETFIPEIAFYLKTISQEWEYRVLALFTELSKNGYGRKKSIGKGQFTVTGIKEFKFPDVEDTNGFITFSNFCPKDSDPNDGLYKTFVKYGKLGEEFTFCGNPFKKPLIMIKTGSVFKTDSTINDFYGRMIKKIAPVKENDVVHYGYAFALPLRIDKPET
jgi:CRISPR-associated protein Csm4